MKISSRLLFALLPLAAQFTHAAEDSGFYGGAALGRVEPDFTDATFIDSTGNSMAGSTLRQEFDRAPLLRLSGGYNWGSWALELSYEHTMTAGGFSVGSLNGDFDYGNWSVAGVYRGAGRWYPLIKLGLSNPDMDTDAPNGGLKLGHTAFAGAGVGYRVKPDITVEFDFTRSGDDTTAFMLGLRKHF